VKGSSHGARETNRFDAEQNRLQAHLVGEIALRVGELFARCPELCGFAVDAAVGLPVYVGETSEGFYLREIVLYPCQDGVRYAQVCDEIAAALAEIASEQPEVCSLLRGHTFARTLQ
jgi:hypothetical protein